MKVKDLIKRLKEFNPEHEVVMSTGEGNSFSKLYNSFSKLYEASGDCILTEDNKIYDRESPADCGESCIVLWPKG